MANLTSYVRWRGDIPFSSQPFCDADNLLFSALAYLDFDGIVPKAPEAAGYLSKDEPSLGTEAPQSDVKKTSGNSKTENLPANEASGRGGPAVAVAAATDTTLAKTAAAFANVTNAAARPARVSSVETIPLQEAARRYLENLSTRKTPGLTARYAKLCEVLLDAARYELVRVGALALVSSDDEPNQFVALTFLLPDGSRYVAFRGTGDEIEDWRQDFMISFTQTAAQSMAVKYLRCRMREAPSAPFYVGGHSKGGNLALYSVMKASAMSVARIRTVYSNDGPGICPELRTAGYDRAVEKLVRIVPEFSVIGMLFEPTEAEPIIVQSDVSGIQQHDAMSWQLIGSQFDLAEGLSKESVSYNHIFDGWIESASMEERAAFTKDFFDALKAGGAVNVQDIAGNGVNGFGTILASLVHSEKATHVAFRKFGESAFAQLKSLKPKDLFSSQLGITGGAVLFLGLIFLIMPRASTHIVGYSLLGIGTILAIRKAVLISVANLSDKQKKLYVLAMILLI
ncbi:MAG: Mbeg1-like protein, partial [Lachnospiraceae bacterium]